MLQQKNRIFIVSYTRFLKKIGIILLLAISSSLFAQQTKSTELAELKIYPNPITEGKVYIETANKDPKKITIYDVFGSSVFEADLKTKELVLPRIKPGIYVIRIYTQEKSSTRKLVIK